MYNKKYIDKTIIDYYSEIENANISNKIFKDESKTNQH